MIADYNTEKISEIKQQQRFQVILEVAETVGEIKALIPDIKTHEFADFMRQVNQLLCKLAGIN